MLDGAGGPSWNWILKYCCVAYFGIACIATYWLVNLHCFAGRMRERCEKIEERLGVQHLLATESKPPMAPESKSPDHLLLLISKLLVVWGSCLFLILLLVSRLLVICLPWLFLMFLLG
jgi:hypothetical protein